MKHKTPKGFLPIVLICLVMILATIGIAAIIMPRLNQDYQGAAGSTAGSIIGTLLAFLGALYLWHKEHQSTKERDDIAQDKNLIRESYVEMGILQALHHLNSKNPEIQQKRRLANINISGHASLISNDSLRSECETIAELIRDDEYLDYGLPEYNRVYIGQHWLKRLYTLPQGSPPASVRPEQYEEIKNVLDELDEYIQMNIEAQIEYQEELRREKQQKS